MKWLTDNQSREHTSIVIEGECDLYSAPAFTRAMLDLLSTAPRAIRFDLSKLSYLDSSGVGSIIKILQASRAKGIPLSFFGLGGTPRRVLSMSNILPLLKEVKE